MTADGPGMRLSKPGFYLFLFALLSLSTAALAQIPQVTETRKVDIGDRITPKKIIVRKINGRWWSEDNREVTAVNEVAPNGDKLPWLIQTEPGAVQFFHHRPLDLSRAESLHLFMRPKEVGAALGEPNAVVGPDDHAVWLYYAADGTRLSVRFMDDGVLGEAIFDAAGKPDWSVAAVERDLNGRDVRDVMRERADQRVLETYHSKPFAVRAQ